MLEKEVILSLIKEGVIGMFMIWLIRYTIPYIDKWLNRWMNDVNLKFDNSRNADTDLLNKYHELDKKIDRLESALESIQIKLNIKPDRRINRRDDE